MPGKCVHQIGTFKSFGEPIKDRGAYSAGFVRSSLFNPQSAKAAGGANRAGRTVGTDNAAPAIVSKLEL